MYDEDVKLDNDTKITYLQEAGQITRQRSLTDNQQKQIREEWDKKIRKGEKASDEQNRGKEDEEYEEHLKEREQAGS